MERVIFCRLSSPLPALMHARFRRPERDHVACRFGGGTVQYGAVLCCMSGVMCVNAQRGVPCCNFELSKHYLKAVSYTHLTLPTIYSV